jgi:hypothetical protein
MKDAFVAIWIGLAALILASCPSPSGSSPNPYPTNNYISFSIDVGPLTTYTNGVTSVSPTISVSTPDVPFASIPENRSYLYLYASNSTADFEAAKVDFVCVYIVLPDPTAPSIGAGKYLNSTGEGANITLQIGAAKYIANGLTYALIDLTLDQSVDNANSIGQTITGTFSGTITPDSGTTSASITGSFNLIYQTTTGTVS